MSTPPDILDLAYERVGDNLTASVVGNPEISRNVEFVCRNPQNRAGVR